MLNTTLLHPELLSILAQAGHHATVLIADGNYPVSSKRGPHARLVSLQLTPGIPTVAQVLRAIVSAVPIDLINTMGIPPDDPYAKFGEPPACVEYRSIAAAAKIAVPIEAISKWDFYKAVESADHVLTVQTADQALWANVLLTIGCQLHNRAGKTTGLVVMRIDAHQHFWRYNAQEYGWIQPHWPIRKDFLPVDLEPLLKSCRMDGCIAVQARQSLEETRWLLELADGSPLIRGVVGWVDLRSGRIGQQLEQFAAHPKLVGVRHVVQDEPDDRFMLRPDFKRGIAALKQFDLTYDILVFPRQLPAALELAGAFPEHWFVLDHLAKPLIAEGELSPWRKHIEMLAHLPNVMCKLSGMVTEAKWHAWRETDFRPYLDVVFQAFGVERLMFGSDWPVALLAGSYEQVYSLVSNYVSALSKTEQAKILGGNAVRFYQRASS